MRVATCVVFISALACLVHHTSAQLNWWERDPDGTVNVANGRRPTTAPTAAPTPAPGASSSTTMCPCPRTPEYNPVCGDDRLTYDNPGAIECAQSCGRRVQIAFYGRCEKLA